MDEPLLFSQRKSMAQMIERWLANADKSTDGKVVLRRDGFNVITALDSVGALDRPFCRTLLGIRQSENAAGSDVNEESQ